ncbi:MAG: hypothetical protein LBH25_06615 [Fibromonadaceae bacterium]|nr:hypothetical protein [Fibromonadaceae bacterium]
MRIDVQKFMELREGARSRQLDEVKKEAGKNDWRTLLDSKRREMGLEPAAPAAELKKSIKTADNTKTRAVAMDFEGSVEERVSALRERSADGLPVRELGNFIDVRA